MKLGKFQIDVLDTGLFALDGGAMFGVVPKNLWSKAYNAGDNENRIPLAARPLLIRYDDKVILVDAGNGNKINEKFAAIYGIDKEKSDIELALSKFNLKRENITDFIYTHLHFDHAGGSTLIENDKIVPSFANAKHYVQKEHYDWAMKPSVKDKASFVPENYMAVIEKGMLELLEGQGDIYPGIDVIPVYGHTKAMQMIHLHDNNENLIFMADLAPTSAHIPVPFVMGYDNYPMTTIEEKQKWLPIIHEEKWTIVFEHDAFYDAGKLGRNDRGFFVEEKFKLI